jgi:hypothetical protein
MPRETLAVDREVIGDSAPDSQLGSATDVHGQVIVVGEGRAGIGRATLRNYFLRGAAGDCRFDHNIVLGHEVVGTVTQGLTEVAAVVVGGLHVGTAFTRAR